MLMLEVQLPPRTNTQLYNFVYFNINVVSSPQKGKCSGPNIINFPYFTSSLFPPAYNLDLLDLVSKSLMFRFLVFGDFTQRISVIDPRRFERKYCLHLREVRSLILISP